MTTSEEDKQQPAQKEKTNGGLLHSFATLAAVATLYAFGDKAMHRYEDHEYFSMLYMLLTLGVFRGCYCAVFGVFVKETTFVGRFVVGCIMPMLLMLFYAVPASVAMVFGASEDSANISGNVIMITLLVLLMSASIIKSLKPSVQESK
jgi:hypothetical protein